MPNIRDILFSKEVNTHHADRYLKFLRNCVINNLSLPISTDLEQHHILPKSVFPQYSILKWFPQNSAFLTPRQHYVAHRILLHVFISMRDKGMMAKAYLMFSDTNSKDYEKAKVLVRQKMLTNNPMHNELSRNKSSETHKNMWTDDMRSERSRQRMGVGNVSVEGKRRLSDRWKGTKRPKCGDHVDNHRQSISRGTWITPWGSFLSPQQASNHCDMTTKLSRHVVDKRCRTKTEGYDFIPRSYDDTVT
ncbi:putative homing endonuclease protein [Rhizobium phage RHph_I1_18]|nr:putative homing endonuclease protein [Rhizobium phage RHph_I1_18]